MLLDIKKLKVQFKNAYMFIEIDFPVHSVLQNLQNLKKCEKKDIYCHKSNIWNEIGSYMNKTVLLHIVLLAKG